MDIQYKPHPIYSIPFDQLQKELNIRVEKGLVFANKFDHLTVYNYSRECQFSKENWDLYTLCSRGLVIDTKRNKVVATPFPKFFNWGEIPEKLPDLSFTTTVKMDGSLGILFWDWTEKRWRFSTRGSLESEQAQWAEAHIESHWIDHLHKGNTYLFEIVFPENRIVIPYDWEGLILLSVYDNEGWEWDYEDLKDFGKTLGCRVVEKQQFSSVEQMFQKAKELPWDNEGWVVRYSNGFRIKIKGDEYCRLHRIISNVTPLAIWEAMLNGDDLESIRVNLPEEILRDFDLIEGLLSDEFDEIFNELEGMNKKYEALSDKELGQMLQGGKNFVNIRPDVMKLLFQCRKNNLLEKINIPGEKCRKTVFKLFRPKNNQLEGWKPSTLLNRFHQEEDN